MSEIKELRKKLKARMRCNYACRVIDEVNEIENLRILCRGCHSKIHYEARGNLWRRNHSSCHLY